MKKGKIVFLIAIVFAFSCKKHYTIGPFVGRETQVNIGKAWTSVEYNDDMTPASILLTMDKYAVQSILLSNFQLETVVELHQKGSYSAIKHVVIDWRPQGHIDSTHTFDKPQFNFYFYMINPAEREAANDSIKLATAPAVDYLPENYISFQKGVPQTGLHWYDETAPEFTGGSLTQSLLYGTYDGGVNFYEWIVPAAILAENSPMERLIPLPDKFKTAGYYPTSIKVEMTDYVIRVTLKQFVYRPAS
jgi:hypothetical protein